MTRIQFFCLMLGAIALTEPATQVANSQESTTSSVPVEATGDAEQTADLFADDEAFAEDFENADISGEDSAIALPDKFQDAAFDRCVDIKLLARALEAIDAELLADVALQFAEGERVLLRPHNAIDTDDVFRLAIRIASEKNDEETFARLKSAVKRMEDKSQLEAQIDAAQELSSKSRAAAPFDVVSIDLTPSAFAAIKTFRDEIERARLLGDKSELATIRDDVQQVDIFDEIVREKLNGAIDKAIESTGDACGVPPALQALNSGSRGVHRVGSRQSGSYSAGRERIVFFAVAFDGPFTYANARNTFRRVKQRFDSANFASNPFTLTSSARERTTSSNHAMIGYYNLNRKGGNWLAGTYGGLHWWRAKTGPSWDPYWEWRSKPKITWMTLQSGGPRSNNTTWVEKTFTTRNGYRINLKMGADSNRDVQMSFRAPY